MRIEDTYNIHCFLYDVLHIGTHHFKRIKYRFEHKTYWKCYCCGKEEELID